MKVPDKQGNYLTVEPNESGELIVGVETIHGAIPRIGILNKNEKLFTLIRNSVPAKFLVEATTFDKVVILDKTIGLNSLRFNLHIPNCIKIESFSEMINIDPAMELIQFKGKFEAIRYMTDFYKSYFDRQTSYKKAVIDEMTIDDPDKLIDTSFQTIYSWLDKKQDPEPYFLNLVRYFNFCVKWKYQP